MVITTEQLEAMLAAANARADQARDAALVAAAYEAAAQEVDTAGDSAVTEALGQSLCCSGYHCGCQGADVGAYLMHHIRALTPDHATEALDRIKADAWDAALVEAADTLDAQALDAEAQAKRFRGGSDPWADRTARSRALRNSADTILALRDKPAPGVTPKIEVKFTWAKGDEEFWVHLKSPDGKSAGFNLGNPKGMIATALLRAIAGGGDE